MAIKYFSRAYLNSMFRREVQNELAAYPFVRCTHKLDVKRHKVKDYRAYLSQERYDRIDYSNWNELTWAGIREPFYIPLRFWYRKPGTIKKAKKGEWYFNFSRFSLCHEFGHLAEIPKEKVIEYAFYGTDWFLNGKDDDDSYLSYECLKREARALVYQERIEDHFDAKIGIREPRGNTKADDFLSFLGNFDNVNDIKTKSRLLNDFIDIQESLTIDQAMSDLRERLGILSDELVSMNKRN